MKEPKIRFKGFTREWEKKVVGDMGTTYSGLSGKTKEDFGQGDASYVTFLNVLTNAQIDTSILEPVNVAKSEHQNLVKKGDLLFNTSSETPDEVGLCAVMDEDVENVYLNSFCFGFRVTDSNIDPKCVAYLMRSPIGRKLMSILGQGATRYNLSKNNFCKSDILLPSDKDEQESIAEYFQNLDSLIQSTTKKIESLKQVKAASLLSMFPQEGETTPRVRFKGFEGEWKPRKLDDICDFLKGKGLSKEKLVVNGKYGCILYGEIFTKYNFEVNLPLSKTDCFEGTLSKVGDIIMPGSTTTFGIDLAKAVHVPYDNVLYGGDIIVLRQKKKDSYDSFFLATQISCIKREQVAAIAQGITIVHIHASNVAELYYSFPSLEEQKAIGTYFRDLDSQIYLLSQRLEKLQQIKSACLDNMFV